MSGTHQLELAVEAIGLAAPGLAGWQAALPVLRGERAYAAIELPPYQPQLLPQNERRRATPVVRQAFRAAEDAMAQSPRVPGELAAVFASSDGDMNILHRICSALAEPTRSVSPTDFHNSVHNAAAGYWSIAVGSRRTSTSIGAYDASAAAGLIEAATLLQDEDAVLLVLYDVPQPVPLFNQHPIGCAASIALVLARAGGPATHATLRLALEHAPVAAESTLADSGLETLRTSNPATRALPLLVALARGGHATLHMPAMAGSLLRIEVEPVR